MKLKTTYFYITLIGLMLLNQVRVQAQNKTAASQTDNSKLVQLSGVITAPNGVSAIPYATVRISHSFRGTIAGTDGFYSLVVKEKDTVEYEALGFKKLKFVIPTGTTNQEYNHNASLARDTFTIAPTNIYANLTPEEFKRVFLSLHPNEDLTEKAKKNLDQQTMRQLYESLAKDGQESQLYQLQQIASSAYYAGGQTNYNLLGNGVAVPSSLLNPFAWAQFIKSIKEGKYKKKKDDKKKKDEQNSPPNYDY